MAAEYNNSELMKMQQDAIRRAWEMQSRANRSLHSSAASDNADSSNGRLKHSENSPGSNRSSQAGNAKHRQFPLDYLEHEHEQERRSEGHPPPRPSPPPSSPPHSPPPPRPLSFEHGKGGSQNPLSFVKNLLGGFTGDSDRTLLIALLLLLNSDDSDELLMLALVYIML